MQRYAQGLAVPKIMLERFASETSSGAGLITVNLKYTPTSIAAVLLEVGRDTAFLEPRYYLKFALTGKALEIAVTKPRYWKPNTTTSADSSGGGGGDPHTHTITGGNTDIDYDQVNNEPQEPIVLSYEVA